MDSKLHPFFSSDDSYGSVRFYLNHPIEELAIFAAGYHEAGRALVDKLEATRGYADYECYPMFFLYRHALELYIKAILYRRMCYMQLLDDRTISIDRFLSRHDMAVFLPAMREIFDLVGWKGDINVEGLETWEDFCSLVKDIEKLDKSSFGFRYPVNQKGDAALPSPLILNVISFGRKMDPVLYFLEGAEEGLDDAVQYANESVHFLKSLADEWRA